MYQYAMRICVGAHDWRVFPVPVPVAEHPLPTHCGICGKAHLDGCGQCERYYELPFFDLDFHDCGAPIPWAAARKALETQERKAQERALRGPSFWERLWTRGLEDAAVEGTHIAVRNGLVALIGALVGVIVGALSPLGDSVRSVFGVR